MQRVTILCVGKLKEKFYMEAVSEYTKRLSRHCKLEILELPEQRLSDNPSQGEIDAALEREAAAIREKLPKGGAVIAMCIEGKLMDSEKLAAEIAAKTVGGCSQMVLLIGYALAGLIRLAYFNVMEEVRQSKDGGKRQYYDGLPITNAALLLSLTFFICRELFPQAMIPAYGTMMAITGVCFVSPIKVKKPSLIGNMAIAFTGLGILFAVFKISGRI